MIILKTERLILRLLEKNDKSMIQALLNQASFIENIGDKGVRDLDGALHYISTGPLAMQKALGFSLYCCELKSTGETIGLSGLIKRDEITHPEIGFAFLSKFFRQGFGFESVSSVINYAKNTLGIEVLQAICNPSNKPSINLLSKTGFVFQKKVMLDSAGDEINLYEKVLAID